MSLAIPQMSGELLSHLTKIQDAILAKPQIELQTEHVIHGGMYTRTIRLAPGVLLMGALIKVPTMLIVSGNTSVFTGESWIQLDGYQVIPARAGRKQIFMTHAETIITMMFRTDAKTVEQAEQEFTGEAESLMSRQQDSDLITITGE